MKTNTRIALVISPVVNAVLFGVGAVAILSVPQLADATKFYLPAWIVLSLLATPFVSVALAPRLRSAAYHRGSRQL